MNQPEEVYLPPPNDGEGYCEFCNQIRTLHDGLCHECRQKSDDASVITDEDGAQWVPGGYRL